MASERKLTGQHACPGLDEQGACGVQGWSSRGIGAGGGYCLSHTQVSLRARENHCRGLNVGVEGGGVT